MIRSLRLRFMLGATVLAVLFMLILLPLLQSAFHLAQEDVIEQRLAADAAALISAAELVDGSLRMPESMPAMELNLLEARQLGFIYDRHGRLVWRSPSSLDEQIDYRPRYDGRGREFASLQDPRGERYFVYDLEVDRLRGEEAGYSIVTMQPSRDYDALVDGMRRQLYWWLGGAWLVLLVLLWLGLTWGFASLRGLGRELDEVENGARERLSDGHPRELLRLTRSLNRLLDGERRQRERYRDSLGDLAHSLKTPLAVLQGVADTLASERQHREQVEVLRTQIERMSQQVDYQLQRASLRRSGLRRHREALGPVLDVLTQALDKVYREKRVVLSRDFPPALHLPVERGALLELLGNLLENAYRLCLGQIRVRARSNAEGCELWVEDDGPGIPAERREQILQRGERLDTRHPGQGIGTAVAKDIIESYGGSLQLEESPLGGACFRIRLPY